MAPLSSSQPGTFASFFHDVGSIASTTSILHSHPLATKITRQPRGFDAFLWALYSSASLNFSDGPFYRDGPKITRNSASALKNVRALTPPRLLSLVFQNLETSRTVFHTLTLDLADLESSRNGWIMNVVADSPSKGLDFASAKEI